ncbi:hypothetical protein MMC07_002530 [Pseudocyphellaria aurata]|nr:hypothetical protein [Pseudocyphellaria aurata]
MRPGWVAEWIMNPSPLMHEATSWMQTVIAPMPFEDCEEDLEALPWFNFFESMRDLSLHDSHQSFTFGHQSPSVTDITRLQKENFPDGCFKGLQILGLGKRGIIDSLTCPAETEQQLKVVLENFVPAWEYITALQTKIVDNYEMEMAGIDEIDRWTELQ